MDLTPHGWIALATLVAVVYLFISKRIPLAMTALSIPVVLAATGTISSADALSGFGNRAVLALAGIFILGAGLKESGVATLTGRALERLGAGSEGRTIVVIMVATAVLSGFMSNAATVAVFLPAVVLLSRRAMIPASRLMMPLAYAAILGGTLTLIGTTPHLILSDQLLERTGHPFQMFDFALIGLPIVATGILYMVLIGRHMLPKSTPQDRLAEARLPQEVARSYGFPKNLYRMLVVPESGIAGKSIREASIRKTYDLDVVLIHRPRNMGPQYLHPTPDLVIQPKDQLYLEGEMEQAWAFAEAETVQFGIAGPRSLERILGRGVLLSEVALAPRSGAIGKTFADLDFRNQTGLNVISVWHRGEVITSSTGAHVLELGDAFLVSGPTARVRDLARDPDFIVLTDASESEDIGRAPVALGLLLLALLPPLFGWLPLAMSVIPACLLMVATRCMTVDNVIRAVDFRILFLVIGTIPLGIALEKHGIAGSAADAMLWVHGHGGNAAMLAALFILSAVLSTTSNNGATAVILAPVAASAAAGAGLEVSKAFLAVAYGTSCAFLLPFAHQCNLMVMGAGGYHTRDFARVGAGLSLVMAATAITMLALT